MFFNFVWSRLIIFLSAIILCLAGCNSVSSRHASSPHVETRMSKSIFLAPSYGDKSCFIEFRNSSGLEGVQIKEAIIRAIANKGYRIVDNFDQATYTLQVNVLSVRRVESSEAFSNVNTTGAVLGGAAIGAGIGAVATESGTGTVVGGIVGSALGALIAGGVESYAYNMITDIRVSEIVKPNLSVRRFHEARIVSAVGRTRNLNSAIDLLNNGLIVSISNIF